MTMTNPDTRPIGRRGLAILGCFALLKILVHLPVLTRYGYHPDELYFIACGEHPAFGYVDHAPLVPFITRAATSLFGESLFGLRILAVLSGAVAIFLTGSLARRLGGGWFASSIACLAYLIAPVYLRSQNMLCLPAFEPLFWVIGFHLVVRLAQGASPRRWLAIGAVIGAGLFNKHSMLFFGFGLLLAVLLTPLRRQLKTPWPWLGGAIAAVLLGPNLVWQAQNEWATAGFLSQLNEGTMSGISALQFLFGQVLYLNPFCAPLWLVGLAYLLFAKEARPYRVLGLMWISIFLLLLLIKSKIYYLAPAFPVVLAAGAVAFERWTSVRRRLRPLGAGLLVAGGAALAPLSLPVTDIDRIERYINAITFGALGNIHELTGDLRNMFGWPERLEAVAGVYQSLSEEERRRAVLLAGSYGNAGAIDYFGERYGLPKAVCLDNSYWIWGLPDQPIDIVISVGIHPDAVRHLFESGEEVALLDIEHANEWQQPFRVTIWRTPTTDLHQVWERNRPW